MQRKEEGGKRKEKREVQVLHFYFLANFYFLFFIDFLEVPDVRRAADGAAAEFDRKRDEALQRLRDRHSD